MFCVLCGVGTKVLHVTYISFAVQNHLDMSSPQNLRWSISSALPEGTENPLPEYLRMAGIMVKGKVSYL